MPLRLVVVGHGGTASFLQRQARLGPVQRLYLRLFIDRQHHGMGGRRDVKPDDIVQFLDEFAIIGQLELTPAMRAQPVRFPDAAHRRGRQPDRLAHGPERPVGCLLRRWRLRQPQNLRDLLITCLWDTRWSRLVAQQPVDPVGHEPFLPAPDAGLGFARRRHDRVGANPVGAQKHDPGAPDMLLSRFAIRDQRLKPLPIRLAKIDDYSSAHAPDSHAQAQLGIPIGTHLFRSIH